MRNGVIGKGEKVINPRGFGGRGMIRGRKEKEFACKVAKGSKGVNSEWEEEYLISVEIGDNGFVRIFWTCCFIVRLV